MYLHLGQGVVVPYRDVLALFDLDNTSASHLTRRFLERAEQAGLLVLTVDGAGVEKTRLVPYPAVLARNDRDNPAACRSGFADSDERAETGSNTLALPCSYRTVAEEYTAGQYSYTHVRS